MTLPLESAPPPAERERAKQRRIVQLTIVLLVLGAIAMLTVAQKLPLPARLFTAATDLVVAAVLVVLYRQKFSGPR